MNSKVELKVPRSGKRYQFVNTLTSYVGTITPIFVEEVLPSQKTKLQMALRCQLPPLASDAFMNLKLKCEAIFVPMRLLCGSFEAFVYDSLVPVLDDYGDLDETRGFCPVMRFDYSHEFNAFDSFITRHSTLADYLGYKGFQDSQPNLPMDYDIPLLPFLAYHRAWDDLYRNSRITRGCFARSTRVSSGQGRNYILATSPFTFFDDTYNKWFVNYDSSGGPTSVDLLADDVSVFSLRQRNYGFDYFTMAQPTPQLGSPASVTVPVGGANGTFTIAALRASNALQQFRDRNAIPGDRFQDVLAARYGADLSNGVAQRCICVGACDYDVYTDGVTNNQQSTPTASNPLSGFGGSRSGVAYAQGRDVIVNDFVANEPGFLFVMATLVPKAQYASGIRRYLRKYNGNGSITDMGNPILQNTGPQAIFKEELDAVFLQTNEVFGYTDRYAEYFNHENEVHGLFRPDGSLKNFVACRNNIVRSDEDLLTISTDFLAIGKTDLSNVTAVSAQLSEYGYQIQVAFDVAKVLPLQENALPTLQDPAYEHGKSISIIRGGFSLN